MWDVKTSGRNICGYKDLELACLESPDSNLSLGLGDTTVHDFDIILNCLSTHELISVGFGLGKDNDLSGSTVDID